jgi:hypothetical protein
VSEVRRDRLSLVCGVAACDRCTMLSWLAGGSDGLRCCC